MYSDRNKKQKKKAACEFCEAVYTLVRMIPTGLVSSYGDIATGLGYRTHARRVAYCLRTADAKEQKDLPWHRVVRGDMKIAFSPESPPAKRQLALLQKEGEISKKEPHRIPRARRWQPGRTDNSSST